MNVELLDAQLRWLLRHGYATWHCYRCDHTSSTMISAYYHLVDHHGLDPQTAFGEGEVGELVDEAGRTWWRRRT